MIPHVCPGVVTGYNSNSKKDIYQLYVNYLKFNDPRFFMQAYYSLGIACMLTVSFPSYVH